MTREEIKHAIEAILFASGDPVTCARIAVILGLELYDILNAAEDLALEYEKNSRGIRLVRIKDGIQLCSAPEHALSITRVLEQRRPPRLTPTALEVLSIIAYFQPVTRAYIERVRGVDSSNTVRILTERGLVEPCGKLEVVGRPTIYRTTELFLRTMGIKDIDDLPDLPDISGDEGLQRLQNQIDDLQEDGQQVMDL